MECEACCFELQLTGANSLAVRSFKKVLLDSATIAYKTTPKICKGGFRRRALLALYSTRINCNLDRPKGD